MELYVCSVCGHVAFDGAPDKCPVCGAAKTAFKADANALKKPADPKNLTDGDKKHIPMFVVKRECGLVDKTCIDAHIKIGQILHVMEEKHWIQWIDLYLNRKFIARFEMAPIGVNPVVGIHLNSERGSGFASSSERGLGGNGESYESVVPPIRIDARGVLTVIESCNIHGKWMAETEV